MAQAYIRQSTFSDGDTITAALFNNEYNQLVNVFAYSSTNASNTGHRHDGTAGQGGNIFKIGDLDFLNKIEIDSTNNRIGFYVEVSSAAVEQIRLQDGALVPVTDSDIDLGTTSLRFKDTFTDSITTTGNIDVGGNLTVTGTTTFNGGTITMGDAATDNVVFGADVDSNIIPDDDDSYDLGSSSQEWRNLFIDGTANIDSLVADTADINGGTIDGAIIGGATPAAITGTAITGTSFVIGSADISEAELETIDGVTAGTVAASKAIVVDSNKDFTGARNITLTGELDAGSLDVSGDVDVDGTLETDALSINGTAVTSTAAELNILDGVTASATDINLIDGITNGTVIASKAIITDSNKDITGGRNITISGELDAATLDISGDADIDGTLEADAITIGGITLAETISDTVGAMVSSNTESNISVTYEDSDNTLDFALPAALEITTSVGVGGGSTNGVVISQGAISIKNGGTQSYIDFYCESSNAHYARLQAPAHSAFSGNITLTLPATTGTLALTSGDITGNAATATALATARTIHGVSFDGTANIDLSEVVQDTVGAMFSSNTETGIAATYEDSDGTIDLVIGSGVITNAMLAGSIANAKLANSSITVSDGSNSTATALGGTITFAGTSNEVEVAESSGTVTVGLPSNVTIGNNLTVTGNLTVSGTTTQTGPIVSDDNFTGLLNNNSANSSDFGFFGKYVESSTTKYAGLYYDASTDNTFRLFADTQTEPAATVDTTATGYAAADLITAGITATTGTFSGDVNVDSGVLFADVSTNRVGVNQTSPDVSLDLGANTDAIHLPVGTTAQRPTGAAGYFRYNSTTGGFEGFTDSWGAIAGSGGSGGSSSTFAKNTFAGDGSTTAFTLTTSMTNEDGLIVFIDGVYQADNVYSVSGTTLTFATAPANSRVIEVFQLEGGIVGVAPVIATMDGDGSDTTLALGTSPSSENQTFVTIDGVVQHKDTYSISGSTLTFSAAPPNGTKVEAVIFNNVSVTTFQDADGDTKIQLEESTDEDKIRFDTGGTERVIIDSTGVGIGTTSPTGKLEIAATGTNAAPHIKLVESGDTREFNIYNDGSGNGHLVLADSDDDTSDTEIVLADNGNIQFKTATSERMLIDSSGNVGIGTTSPQGNFHVVGASGGQGEIYVSDADEGSSGSDSLLITKSGTTSFIYDRDASSELRLGAADNSGIVVIDGSNQRVGIGTTSPAEKLEVNGNIKFGDGHTIGDGAGDNLTLTSSAGENIVINSVGGITVISSNGTEKARFADDGTLFHGRTSDFYMSDSMTSKNLVLDGGTGANDLTITSGKMSASTMYHIGFFNSNSHVGNISTNGSTTSYTTSSDYRLKENINYNWKGLEKIKNLKPAQFNFKADKNKIEEGFIAHEAQEVTPYAVVGEKDGETKQTMDYGRITPILVKAIQEQQELIETLTARIETLEGGE